MAVPKKLVSATRRLDPALLETLRSLTAGDRIQIWQTVRVGSRKWTAETAGTYRGVNHLATGITTDRVPEDDIVVPTVHFTKDNGELASISVDENTKIERL
jgi:hypothetical protein